MSVKSLNMTSIFLQNPEHDKKQDERDTDHLSFESIPEKNRPGKDFRALVSNLQTIEDTMTARAKTMSQKTQLLHTWEKLKGLLCAMIDRLEKDIERARRIEKHLEEAKEQARALQMRNGIYSRFN